MTDSKLVEHLAKCDLAILEKSLGDSTMVLLRRVASGAIVPKGLAALTVHTLGEEGTLRNPEIRRSLVGNLTPAEGQHLCGVLGLPDYAPSATLPDVDFDNDVQNFRSLAQFFNVSADLAAPQIESSRNAAPLYHLRTHQADAYRKLRRRISDPSASALIHMPYAAGKLRTVATAVLDLYRSEADGRTILWLGAGDAVCEDAFEELSEVWGQLGSRNVILYRHYGAHPVPDLNLIDSGIIVADVARLPPTAIGLKDIARRTRVVVVSDAELLRHSQFRETIDELSREGEFSLVGISASPAGVIRTRSAYSPLAAKFAGSCITIDAPDPIGLLREAGDVGAVTIELASIADASAQQIDVSGVDLTDELRLRLSRDVDRNEKLLEIVHREAHATPGPIAMFATSSEHARLFAGLLGYKGIRAVAVTDEMSHEQRDIELHKFNSRNDKVVCLHGFFLSSAHAPNIATAVVALPSISSATIHQIVGRLAGHRPLTAGKLRFVFIADPIPDYIALVKGLETWDDLGI
ncbi:hypothetical protein [Aminobacter sp. MSH1]|uniref:DEAD/DEAH box helicase n=1 Tax=Aminobacter sp. MSH1 TaxID=374606 RepID=UPI000D39420D|nr:hypothetical protein [Aminobacter sp. MSH1]